MTKNIIFIAAIMAVLSFARVSPALHAADQRTSPIDLNLIIDGSAGLSPLYDQVTAWISANLTDALLQSGDTVTVWSAGASAKTIYSRTLQDTNFRDELKRTLQNLTTSGDSADFAGALAQAASRKPVGNFSYTVLITASTAALSPTLLGPQANLMQFSRIEEFAGWRAVVVGLNIDAKVKQAASAYLVSPQESHSGT
jgi:hypothetical protein